MKSPVISMVQCSEVLQYMRGSSVTCSTVQCSAVQYTLVEYRAMQYSAVYTMHCAQCTVNCTPNTALQAAAHRGGCCPTLTTSELQKLRKFGTFRSHCAHNKNSIPPSSLLKNHKFAIAPFTRPLLLTQSNNKKKNK